jgi:hypothetical protein
MKLRITCAVFGFLSLLLSLVQLTFAQTPTQTASALPRLVRFIGTVKDLNGSPLTGVVGITFSLYSEQTGGAPLWLETQNVTADSNGHYTVLLGSTMPDGLPAELFTSEQAHWVGVQVSDQAEQPRVLLVSAPYALKAGDAETIGGLPPSAFVLAAPGTASAAPAPTAFTASAASQADAPAASDVTGAGTTDFIPLWTSASNLGNSVLFQSGTGSTARIGINTTTPSSTLGVNGAATIGGLTLPAEGRATATAGTISHALNLVASTFNSSTSKAVNQTFRWQTEPTGNDTSSPSGTLNLLFAEGTSAPAETGLYIASNGNITFASGQVFPGTGDGTITGVTAGTGLTGGGSSGSVTLSVDTTKVPQLNAANTFTGNQTINGTLAAATTTITGNLAVSGNVTAAGIVSASEYEINGAVFAFGNPNTPNAFLGFAGNPALSGGTNDVGVGPAALGFDTGGYNNVAIGVGALESNSGGSFNTAVGTSALVNNNAWYNTATGAYALENNGNGATTTSTTGLYNTATGAYALGNNIVGNANTASGFEALLSTTGSNNTATGAYALQNNTASNNTASGAYALYGTTPDASTGGFNVATGYVALNVNTSGYENTASGAYALFLNNTGFANTATGTSALLNNTTGQENTATGMLACQSNTTGSGLICTGFNADVASPDLHNATAIGAHALVSVSDAVVLGSVAGVNGAKATARVGIGTASPTNLLTLGKGAGPSIADGWSTYSSRRWKTNIRSLHNALGIVEQLRGVSYNLKDSGKHEIGVIAEEVGAVVPEVVTYEENGKDARGVDYSRLTALLIEAVKQQQREIRALKSELRSTRQTLQKVKAQVAAAQPALVAEK